jgi:cystathionine beta-lyase
VAPRSIPNPISRIVVAACESKSGNFEKNTNTLSLVQPEGTFLAWLDFRELGLGAKELARFLAEEAGLALSPGYWFGREGAGFARMTIGCPRATVQQALDRLAIAIKKLS